MARTTFVPGDPEADPPTADKYTHDWFPADSDLVHTDGLFPGESPDRVVNLFPYVLLADDRGEGNRSGYVLQGASQELQPLSLPVGPTGNYDPPNGGWQIDNLGVGTPLRSFGWTGYDFVHQGQRVDNSFRINPSYLPTSPNSVTFDVALVVKWTDPRKVGYTKWNNNPNQEEPLPSSGGDVSRFAYRLPHAALDVSVIDGIPTEIQIGTAPQSESDEFQFRVRDWDAQAGEFESCFDAVTDMEEETEVGLVLPDTGVNATLEVEADCPAPTADGYPVATLETPGATGVPGDELEFSLTITNDNGGCGVFPGLIRVRESEGTCELFPQHIATPNPDDLIPAVTYQAFHVTAPKPPTWGGQSIVTPDEPYGGGRYPSIGVIPGGDYYNRAVVSYQNGNTDSLHVAYEDGGGGWVVEEWDSKQGSGRFTSLVATDEGVLVSHVCVDSTPPYRDLRFAFQEYGNWTGTPLTGIIDSSSSSNELLAINLTDTSLVAYPDAESSGTSFAVAYGRALRPHLAWNSEAAVPDPPVAQGDWYKEAIETGAGFEIPGLYLSLTTLTRSSEPGYVAAGFAVPDYIDEETVRFDPWVLVSDVPLNYRTASVTWSGGPVARGQRDQGRGASIATIPQGTDDFLALAYIDLPQGSSDENSGIRVAVQVNAGIPTSPADWYDYPLLAYPEYINLSTEQAYPLELKYVSTDYRKLSLATWDPVTFDLTLARAACAEVPTSAAEWSVDRSVIEHPDPPFRVRPHVSLTGRLGASVDDERILAVYAYRDVGSPLGLGFAEADAAW